MATKCSLDAGSVRLIGCALAKLEHDLERADDSREAIMVVHAWLGDVQRALREIEEPIVH